MNASDEAPPPEIRLENVTKSFGDKVVLDGIDVTIRNGELVALVGGSGSGKSVMLDLILGLLTPTKGRVLVANHSRDDCPLQDINQLDDRELDQIRLHWSVVFQHNALFSGTVRENITLWLQQNTDSSQERMDESVRDSLQAVGFEDHQTVAAKRRSELSGGMAKRVAIARAIAMEPEIIFYDEPTSGLDPKLSKQIHALISDIHRKKARSRWKRTSLVITHDKDLLARLRPRIIMLHDGGVHFDGTYEDFAESDSEVIRPYFELMPQLQALPESARVREE